MENLHLKNLDMSKILKKLKPNDDYIDEEDDDDFEYDDEDVSWEWTDKDEEEFRKYRRHERILTTLMITILVAIPIILCLILLLTEHIAH